jgi:hypothetical protein
LSKTKFSDPKLFSLLHSLTGVEKRELHQFLASPFFNRRAEVSALWQMLLNADIVESGGYDKAQIYEKLFPGQPYDDGRLRYTFTFLREKIEWLLAYRQWDGQPVQSDLALLASYRERGLEKHFQHIAQQTGIKLADMPHGLEKLHDSYQLEFEKYSFSETQKRSRESALQDLHDAFDLYAISGKLRLACLMAAHQAVVKVDYDYSFLALILNWLAGSSSLEKPEIGLYYHCYRALSENDEGQFRAFRSVLNAHGERFDAAELKDILLLGINFCIRQVNAGAQQFVAEAFGLYQLGLERGSLLERGMLSRFTYKNIVALGLGLQQFDWVERFIQERKPLLEARHQESSFCFNLAKLYFTKKDYSAAMPLLAQVGDADPLLMLDAKVLLLKMYYETGEWDALDALLTSIKTFLRRKTSIGYHKEHYLSLVHYTHKLLILNPNERKEVESLKAEIEAASGVLEREWLLGRINSTN